MSYSTVLGIVAGLAAGSLWGASFLVPTILTELSPTTLALGRFFFFGLSSLLFLLSQRGWTKYLKKDVLAPLLTLTIAGYSGYYMLLCLAVQSLGVSVSSLIIGLLPVTIALSGHKGPWRRDLVFSLLLIVAGIGFVNRTVFETNAAQGKPLGWAALLICLACWTWFAIRNAAFLKKHRIPASIWTSYLGVMAFVTMVVFAVVQDLNALRPALGKEFVLGSFFLGVGSSFVATWLWNIASTRLSASLCGQLIVSETIFGLLYGFLYDQRWPYISEWLAMFFLIGGVLLGVRALTRK